MYQIVFWYQTSFETSSDLSVKTSWDWVTFILENLQSQGVVVRPFYLSLFDSVSESVIGESNFRETSDSYFHLMILASFH